MNYDYQISNSPEYFEDYLIGDYELYVDFTDSLSENELNNFRDME